MFGPAAGYLTALQAAVVLLAALGLGRWADRWNAQSTLIAADLIRMTVLLALIATWLTFGQPAVLPLIVTVVVLAAAQAVFQPALQVVLPGLLTDRAMLPAANALLDATDRSARLLGPGLIAILAGALPAVHFISLDAASFLVSACMLALIRRSRRVEIVRPPEGETMRQAIGRGVRAMTAHPLLGYVLRSTALVNGTWYAAYFLAVPLLIDRLSIQGPGGTGLGAFGLVIAAYGSTNLISTLILGGRPMATCPQRVMFSGGVINGLGTALIVLVPLLPPDWRLAGLSGFGAISAIGGPMKDVPFAVLRQVRLPARDLAAGARAYIAMASAGMLIAMLVAPMLLQVMAPGTFILGSGMIMAATGLTGLLRHRDHVEAAL